jgi:ABC-2 type transport system ATP-binding protein
MPPASGTGQLARVGFVAQDTPVYERLSVADHLRLGAWLNPGWDGALARRRVERLGLDPLARREFLQGLMEVVAEHGVSVVISSHLIADLERVCDYLVVLTDSRVQIAGDVSELLASHYRVSGRRRDPSRLPANQEVITQSHTDKQSALLVRTDDPVYDPAWAVTPVTVEDLVLAYMSRAREARPARPSSLEVAS